MGRRVLGCLVGAAAAASLGFAWSPAHAAPTAFTCETSIGATPATLTGSAVAGFSFTAQGTCDTIMAAMAIGGHVIGPSGDIEVVADPDTCGSCAGVTTSGAVPIVVPGSRHRLVVDLSETAPHGQVWGNLDPGPGGSCSGVGTPTSHCQWNVPVEQPIGPLVVVGQQSTESGVADAAQGILDHIGK